MKDLKVWSKIDGSCDLEGRKPVGNKWVFKIKRNGQMVLIQEKGYKVNSFDVETAF
jgi:hypothetical protein